METGSYVAIPNFNISNPIAIGFDGSQKTIYYSDVRLHQLRSTNIDGSGMSIVKQLNGGMVFLYSISYLVKIPLREQTKI